MRSIRGEVALNPKPFFEPVQSQVDRRYQRTNLARKLVGRQPDARPGRADAGGDLGRLPKRLQGASEDRDIRDQKDKQDRQRDPADILVEIGDDVVDQHVAIGEILASLNPDGLTADASADAGARDGRIASPLLQKFDRAGSGVGRKQRSAVFQRGKQHAPLVVDHRIGIAPVFLRIEPEQV